VESSLLRGLIEKDGSKPGDGQELIYRITDEGMAAKKSSFRWSGGRFCNRHREVVNRVMRYGFIRPDDAPRVSFAFGVGARRRVEGI